MTALPNVRAMTLGEACVGRTNNFDFIRFVAASLVLVSHSWPLTGRSPEPFAEWTGFDTLGGISVNVFFVLSGFLITQSFTRQPSLGRFLEARVLRIVPALALVTVFGIVLGATQTTLPLGEYLSHGQTWRFLRNAVFDIQYALPGVFDSNPEAHSINGSLWTLPAELTMYLVTMVLGLMLLLKDRLVGTASLLAVGVWIVAGPETFPLLLSAKPVYTTPAVSYIIGSIFFLLRDHVPLTLRHAAAFWVLAWVFRDGPNGRLMVWIAIAYLSLWASLARPVFAGFGKRGDFSYGMYLFAFPMQQLVVARGWATTPFALMALAFPLTLLASVVSWHLVEARALALKGKLVRRTAG